MQIAGNRLLGLATIFALIFSGCGDGGEGGGDATSSTATGAGSDPAASASGTDGTGSGGLTTASISAGSAANSGSGESGVGDPEVDVAANQRVASEPPEKGSPRWLILQMTQIRMLPLPETDNIEQLAEVRRSRNEHIAALAEETIALTHKDPNQEAVFNVAVHRLMAALLELSLQGDQKSVDALFSFADSFYNRDPKSRAAAESAWFLARFANVNAGRFADKDVRWLQEFSRQARSFADRFPEEQKRGVGLLNDAGASCDYYGMREEAILCFEALRQKYPDTPQAEQAIPALRRLNLIGKPLDLGGPTLDGGFISVADFKGSPVLVVFWSTQAAPFIEQSAGIIATTEKYEARGLQILGVNLDTDESAIDSFLEKSRMGWRTVFHTDAERRGWKHPVAAYYGVTTIPQIWLVDAEGKAVTTSIAPKDLDAKLAKLLPATKTVASPAENTDTK